MSIQGQLLEVTVVGCSKLKDTEWISRQDPYVRLEYATTKIRTRTCTDGGKNPTFQEKSVIPLIEGLREISVAVWNSNTITFDDFIGSGRIQLAKVLSQGYDDSSWALQTKSGKFAGEVKVIMHFAGALQQQQQQQQHQQQQHGYQHHHKPQESNYPTNMPPPYTFIAPPASSSYTPPPLYHSATTNQYSAPGSAYQAAYPPAPYPSSTYPPLPYPPTAYPPHPYPPPPPANPYHASGSRSGIYPPPSY